MKGHLLQVLITMGKTLLNSLSPTCLFSRMLLGNAGRAQHQSIKEVLVTLDLEGATLKQTIDALEAQTGFKFAYSGDLLPQTKAHRITLKVDQKSVAYVLKQIAKWTELIFQQNGGVIVIGPQHLILPDGPKVPQKNLTDRLIKGTVTGDKGEALPDVSVIVKGTNNGTITDYDGNFFFLNVPDDGATLLFTLIGYVAREVEVGATNMVNVKLQPDISRLDHKKEVEEITIRLVGCSVTIKNSSYRTVLLIFVFLLAIILVLSR